ncbi:unnamed protein product [Parnassius apollo]|uniref:(apollo) hypothetical protein n=1 Tax=Parnassius apollo TaxID=110799 RepID=A0A8S3Y130_PARAO|nr:unnamed protein product [Parnassius apollo]
MDINTEEFISAVQHRTAIWQSKHLQHSNRKSAILTSFAPPPNATCAILTSPAQNPAPAILISSAPDAATAILTSSAPNAASAIFTSPTIDAASAILTSYTNDAASAVLTSPATDAASATLTGSVLNAVSAVLTSPTTDAASAILTSSASDAASTVLTSPATDAASAIFTRSVPDATFAACWNSTPLVTNKFLRITRPAKKHSYLGYMSDDEIALLNSFGDAGSSDEWKPERNGKKRKQMTINVEEEFIGNNATKQVPKNKRKQAAQKRLSG